MIPEAVSWQRSLAQLIPAAQKREILAVSLTRPHVHHIHISFISTYFDKCFDENITAALEYCEDKSRFMYALAHSIFRNIY
jgi:hypothetical protein